MSFLSISWLCFVSYAILSLFCWFSRVSCSTIALSCLMSSFLMQHSWQLGSVISSFSPSQVYFFLENSSPSSTSMLSLSMSLPLPLPYLPGLMSLSAWISWPRMEACTTAQASHLSLSPSSRACLQSCTHILQATIGASLSLSSSNNRACCYLISYCVYEHRMKPDQSRLVISEGLLNYYRTQPSVYLQRLIRSLVSWYYLLKSQHRCQFHSLNLEPAMSSIFRQVYSSQSRDFCSWLLFYGSEPRFLTFWGELLSKLLYYDSSTRSDLISGVGPRSQTLFPNSSSLISSLLLIFYFLMVISWSIVWIFARSSSPYNCRTWLPSRLNRMPPALTLYSPYRCSTLLTVTSRLKPRSNYSTYLSLSTALGTLAIMLKLRLMSLSLRSQNKGGSSVAILLWERLSSAVLQALLRARGSFCRQLCGQDILMILLGERSSGSYLRGPGSADLLKQWLIGCLLQLICQYLILISSVIGQYIIRSPYCPFDG